MGGLASRSIFASVGDCCNKCNAKRTDGVNGARPHWLRKILIHLRLRRANSPGCLTNKSQLLLHYTIVDMNTYIDYIASARGTAHAKMSAKTQQPQECQDESHEMLPVGAQDLARRFCTLEKCSIGVPCADGYTTRVVHARRMSASVQFRAAHVNKWATKKWASKLADQHKVRCPPEAHLFSHAIDSRI